MAKSKTGITIKQIENLLDRKLKPLNHRLDRIDKKQGHQSEVLDAHTQTLDAHTRSLVFIEDKVTILPDLMTYAVEHSEKLKDHEERISSLESQTQF